MVVGLDFGDFFINDLLVGIFNSRIEPSGHFLEHLDESLFSKLMVFDLCLALQRLWCVDVLSFEFFEELDEVDQFIGVFDEVPLDDQGQELDEH